MKTFNTIPEIRQKLPQPQKLGLKTIDQNLMANIIGWDVVNWSQSIDYWERNSTNDLSTKSCDVLEVGAGNWGGLSLWLAMKGCNVVCSTLGGASEKLMRRHEKHPISRSIEYADVDVLSMAYKEKFDVIIFKSLIGSVGLVDGFKSQKLAMKNIYSALKPGGELLFVENLVSTSIHTFFRNKYGSGSYGWRYVSIKEMEYLLSPFSQTKFTTNGFLGLFGRNEAQRNILGQFDKKVFDALVPAKWNYIITGVAKK